MSVFVNLSVNAENRDSDNAILTSRTKGSDIVANPSLYSVGVERMKVPLNNIPLFRLYAGDFKMATTLHNSYVYGDTFGPTKEKIQSMRTNVFGLNDDLPYDTTLDKQVFPNSLPNLGIDRFNNKIFRDFWSNEELCDFLNLGMLRCIGNAFTDNVSGISVEGTTAIQGVGANGLGHTGVNPAVVKLKGDIKAENTTGTGKNKTQGKISVVNFDIDRSADSGLEPSSIHEYITSLEVDLAFSDGFPFRSISNEFAGSFGNNKFSHLSMWVSRLPIDVNGDLDAIRLNAGDSDTWCIFKNIFEGYEPQLVHGLNFSTHKGVSTVRENKSSKGFKQFVGNTTQGSKYRMALDYIVAKDIIGKRADGYAYELFFYNESTFKNRDTSTPTDALEVPHWILSAEKCKLFVRTAKMGECRAVEPYAGGLATGVYQNPSKLATNNDTNVKLAPYFNYNHDSKKVDFNMSNHQLLGMGMNIYMNNNLNSLFSFERFIVDRISTLTDLNNYIATPDAAQNDGSDLSLPTIYTDNENLYNGVLLGFKPQYGNMGPNRNNKSEYYAMNRYEEEQNTGFRRDWLNGILVLSPNLAINGEIVGDGTNNRKIITDFQIDPSTTGRDYLIFNNDGGMRLYELRSTTAIKDIEIIVNYQTIYGDIRPLPISKLTECQLKLEFRPNAQVYNIGQDISAFDY